MKAVYDDDKNLGPGHGYLRVSEAGLGNLEGLRLSIRRGTDHNCLGPGGWQPAESPFEAARISLADEGFDIAVGPEIVDHLDTRENYRLSLIGADGSSVTGSLRVPSVAYSPVGGGRGIGLAPAPEAAPANPPAPAPEVPVQAPVREDPIPEILEPTLPPAPERSGKRPLVLILVLILCLLLAGGVFAVWKLRSGKEDQAKPVENMNATSPGAAGSNATRPDTDKKPSGEESGTPPAPAKPALTQAREHLAGKPDPAASVKLARSLREERDGADASFLLVEDAAQKGDAEAMLLTGGYFDPGDTAPAGSIKKDPLEAFAWYTKARAAGNAQADSRLAALRSWAMSEAARGSPEARRLLTLFASESR